MPTTNDQKNCKHEAFIKAEFGPSVFLCLYCSQYVNSVCRGKYIQIDLNKWIMKKRDNETSNNEQKP